MDSSDGTRVSEFCTALSLWVKPEHNPLGNDRSLLCQYLMAITSLGGDSGSPYYTPVGSTDNVRLYGIHMGIWDGSKVVSPLGGIYSDLGSSVTWNSCASPYTC